MNEITRPISTTARLLRRITDGATLQTGKTVKFSIRRQSDGRYWDGSAFTSTTYAEVSATDAYVAAQNNHTRGLYYYDIAGPAAADVYEWCSVYTDTYDIVESGEIRWTAVDANAAAARTRVELALAEAAPGTVDGVPTCTEEGHIGQTVTVFDITGTYALQYAAIKDQTDLIPASPASTSDTQSAKLAADGLDLVIPEPDSPTLNIRQALALVMAAVAGKASGLAGTTATFKGVGGTTTRISATVDEDGNRSAVTVTPPA